MRFRTCVAAVAVGSCLLSATALGVTPVRVPAVEVPGGGIVAASDGALWIMELADSGLDRMNADGVVDRYAIPGNVGAIAIDRHERVWFTDLGPRASGSRIGWLVTNGDMREFPIDARHEPVGLAAGPNGAMWFTTAGPSIGNITADGRIEYVALPALGRHGMTAEITGAPDGSVWFLGFRRASVMTYAQPMLGHVDPRGTVSLRRVTGSPGLQAITAGPDGTIWFSSIVKGVSVIDSLDANGRLRTRRVRKQGRIKSLAVDPGGSVWLTGENAPGLWRMSPDGRRMTVVPGSQGNSPDEVAIGADGSPWFVATFQALVGHVTAAGTVILYPPTAVPIAARRRGDRVLAVLVRCPATAPWVCGGSVSLWLQADMSHPSVAAGRAPVHVPPGHAATVRVRLNRVARRVMSRAHPSSVSVEVHATSLPWAGVQTRDLQIRPLPPRRRTTP